MPDILTTHALVDDVLDTFRDVLGPHAVRYRNHVYRGMNYQRKLLQLTTIPDEIALAWALHDIGIWTSGWDYIQPSLNQVDELAPRYRVAPSTGCVRWWNGITRCDPAETTGGSRHSGWPTASTSREDYSAAH